MKMTINANTTTNRQKTIAWAVHLFTASGAIWGLLSLIAIANGRWKEAFLWIAISVVVDGLDGSLARRARVKQTLPQFDGALLDNMVDYFTYVLVPAFLLYNTNLVPAGWELFSACLIILASAYQFCQADAKTKDHYFKGFPSYWNVVVFYLFVLETNAWLNLGLILLLAILVFVPIKYVYPSRTVRLQQATLLLTVVWAALILIIVLNLPDPSPWLVWVSFLYILYYIGLSLYGTVMGPVKRRRRKGQVRATPSASARNDEVLRDDSLGDSLTLDGE